jgi:hypothetical protein
MHFWAPEIDPAHPLDCTQPERYVLRHLTSGTYVAMNQADGQLLAVAVVPEAYQFHTHEAALRAASELNRLGGEAVDVVKVE